ncbi:MAG: hypothetical protein HC828_16735 [Blastochloris sp.]|nr:hypothetical protein [Blastochloris sp.]
MQINLIGFGVVGRGFVTLLRDKAHDLRARYGFEPRVVGVATRSGGRALPP